ncbi:MAG: RNA polymerase sigma factor [Bacteroidia bacterium]
MTFDEIYFEHHVMVYNLALQYVQNIEDAEEITQDVFVKVSSNLQNFKQQSSVKTWIYRIAINQSLDFLKAKNSQKSSFLSSIFSLNDVKSKIEPITFNHPGIELEQKEAYRKIFEAINQLPDNQKTAIILLKIEDKSQSETAEIMNLNIKALESLFQRAKKNLDILLNKKG